MAKITQDGIEFLRRAGVGEDNLQLLGSQDVVGVSSDILLSWMRVVFQAGQRHARDPYRWYSVEELIER
jgi:hypothetical protein